MTEESYNDDADVSQLETRIDELEATIRKMLPSRREALGMGVAGLAGASLMSGTASAGSAQVGTIGDNSNLVDLVAEDVTITDTLNTASLSGAAADEALLSDGSGNLTFGSVGGVEEVSTFGNLPAIDPPQLAYVTGEGEYYHSSPLIGAPFDTTTASLENSINSQDTIPHGIVFGDSGSNLIEIGAGSNEIYQSILATPFDLNTSTFDTSISSQSSNPKGVRFNNDGTRLYELGGSGTSGIFEYTLSTPFDLGTASFSTSASSHTTNSNGFTWNDTGSKYFEVDATTVYELSVSPNFDISSLSLISSTSLGSSNQGIEFNDSGSKMFLADFNGPEINEYSLGTPFDTSTATLQNTFSASGGGALDVIFDTSGERMYQSDSDDKIFQYSLSTGGWETF